MEIRKKLPLVTILLVALPLIILSVIYYAYISNQLVNSNENKIEKVLEMEGEYLSEFFDTRKLEIEYLSNLDSIEDILKRYNKVQNINDEEVQELHKNLNSYFKVVTNTKNDISDIFIVGADGTLLASNNPNSYWITLSDRQYFQDAMNNVTSLSTLLKDKVEGRSVIFVAHPIKDSETGKVIGVIANIFDMNSISEGIKELVDPEVGKAYIVDLDGTIIFHGDTDMIGTEIEDEYLNEYFSDITHLDPVGKVEFESGDTNNFVVYKKIQNTKWTLIIEQNMDVVLKSTNDALLVISVICIVTTLIAIYSSVRLVKSFTVPLTELTEVIGNTSKNKLFRRVKYNKKNEFGILASSFNNMLDELTGAYEEITEKNNELIKNYEEIDKNRYDLLAANARINIALKGARDVIWEWNLEDNTFYASEQWKKITGKSKYVDKIEITAFEELLSGRWIGFVDEKLNEIINNPDKRIEVDFPYVKEEKEIIWIKIKASGLKNDKGDIIKITGIMSDITYQKNTEERIKNLAFVDQLTGIPNRTAFNMDVDSKIKKFETKR